MNHFVLMYLAIVVIIVAAIFAHRAPSSVPAPPQVSKSVKELPKQQR